MMEKCELLFAIFDISRPVDDYDRWLIDEINNISCPKIALLNKCDERRVFDTSVLGDGFDAILEISTVERTDEAIIALTETVNKLYTDERITVGEDAIISSARQHAAILRALELVCTARDALTLGVAQDAVSSDIERAIGALGELDGREVGEAVVADIFSRFCVGK
jgi:tRNA modification GTPase